MTTAQPPGDGDGDGDGVELDPDPVRIDVERLHHWLCDDAYWALGRSRETVERSLRGSQVLAAYDATGMVGFARAVTDSATFAWICDVYVDPSSRGRGVGSRLVAALVAGLFDDGVSRVTLATQDAHEVYRRIGFTALAHPDRWMEIHRPPASVRLEPPPGGAREFPVRPET